MKILTHPTEIQDACIEAIVDKIIEGDDRWYESFSQEPEELANHLQAFLKVHPAKPTDTLNAALLLRLALRTDAQKWAEHYVEHCPEDPAELLRQLIGVDDANATMGISC